MFFTETELEEVVSVFPSRPGEYSLHTTRSWEFAGLIGGGVGHAGGGRGGDMLARARGGMDAIVGVLDSGKFDECLPLHSLFVHRFPRDSWQYYSSCVRILIQNNNFSSHVLNWVLVAVQECMCVCACVHFFSENKYLFSDGCNVWGA